MFTTEEEVHDIATGVEADNGPEAWKRLVKRWDPLVAGKNLSLISITRERCRIED